jgi:hypothetical protein
MKWTTYLRRFKLDHLAFWLAVGLVWYYLRYQDYSTSQKAALVTLIKTADLAIMIYVANYVLLPALLYRKRYFSFALAFIMMVLASSTLKMFLIGEVLNAPILSGLWDNLKLRVYDNVIPHFFLVTAGVAVKLAMDHTRIQKRLAEVAREKAEAELNFLKSQINPHFLFNSLNAVYFLIDKNNTNARAALHKFSDMLRYQLYECNGEKIPVEKEIGYLKDYVDLQRLRLNENSTVKFNCRPEVGSFSIEPLLLIPFVENSFKHLSHYSHHANEVTIDISRSNGSMHFSVFNTTEGRSPSSHPEAGGIGLVNVQKRLALLYPGKHRLLVTEKEGWFGIELTLSIHGS